MTTRNTDVCLFCLEDFAHWMRPDLTAIEVQDLLDLFIKEMHSKARLLLRMTAAEQEQFHRRMTEAARGPHLTTAPDTMQ